MGSSEAGRKSVAASEEVPASEARDRLTDMMNRAAYRGERFILTKNGEPIAALIGAEELARLDAKDEGANAAR